MLWRLKPGKYIASLALVLLAATGYGQSADQAFYSGAQEYISGSKELAKQIVSEALTRHPNDPKLNRLYEKIKEEQDKEKEQQKQKNQNEQEKKDQEQDKEQQQKQDQQDKQDEQQQNEKEGEDQQSEDEQEKKPGDQGEEEKEQKDKEDRSGKPQPIKISREDAERLLEALSKEEQGVQKKVNEEKMKGKPVKTDKDW